MKKITFLLFIGVCSALQAQDYMVTTFNEPYQDLTNATSVNNGEVWDDDFYAIPIGFNFELYGQNYSTIYTSDIGNGGALSFQSNVQTNYSVLSPIIQDIVDKGIYNTNNQSVSPISYAVEGDAGNRIFKLEFKNVGFWSNLDDYLDFQVWLYESNNSIEYRYGPNSINNLAVYEEETGPVVFFYPSINIINSVSFIEDGYYLKDDPANPTVIVADDSTPEPENAIVGTIPEGTVYRFGNTLAVDDNDHISVSVYPNPTQNVVYIQNPKQEKFKASLYDVLGNKIEISTQNEEIDLTSVASGTYFLKIQSHSASKIIKILKK